jgi:hypothetical protein
MVESTLRGKLLKRFYDSRHNASGWVPTSDMDLAGEGFVNRQIIGSICRQLTDSRLIRWKTLTGAQEGLIIGMAQITAIGIDVIDGKKGSPIAIDIPSEGAPAGTSSKTRQAEGLAPSSWDVFISHAGEDKEAFARPLAKGLSDRGITVWFDEFTLTVGDSLRRSIDQGLARSRFGIVVVSKHFLHKEWPQKELDGLVAREVDGIKVILPVWHQIEEAEIRSYSPLLADRVAVTSNKGLDHVIAELVRAIRRDHLIRSRDVGAFKPVETLAVSPAFKATQSKIGRALRRR